MELKVEKADYMAGTVNAPPSKSYSHRAFIIASLAQGNSKLKYPLYSDDTLATIDSCRAFGTDIKINDEECIVKGKDGVFKTPDDVLNVKNSGTTLRMITSTSSLAPGYTIITGDDSLRRRPMQELITALKKLGVTVLSSRNNGLAPIIIKGGLKGGEATIKGDISSQYISSLLITSPYADNPVQLKVEGDFISKPYVDMTLDIMQKFGVQVDYNKNNRIFNVETQKYKCNEYNIEGDYSSASYLIAGAAILDSEVTIKNLNSKSKQGDRVILDIVKKMGCNVRIGNDEVIIRGDGNLEGINVNLKNTPDLLPTVAALGAVASGTTNISGVEHARYKETDRINTTVSELKKLGISAKEERDGIIIRGGIPNGGLVDSHQDHRLVMALYLIGLKIGKVIINNSSAYNVSFPNFPNVMKELTKG